MFGLISSKVFSPVLRSSARSSACFRVVPQFRRCYSNEITPNSPVLAYGANPVVKYTENHEWIALHKDNLAFVGITKYAADALGDTTFVEVNDPANVEAGESIGSVESVKSASDVYAPVSGNLLERNEDLIANPALLNEDPMGKAWLAKIEVADPASIEGLLTLESYVDLLEDSH